MIVSWTLGHKLRLLHPRVNEPGTSLLMNEAIEFVQNNARYYDDGSLEPYAVMYEGKFIWAESPGDLVTNLLELVNS